MPKIALVARVAFTHEGQALLPGETFEATPIQAAALTYRRRAIFATTHDLALTHGRAVEAEPDAPRLRRYRRRDLTAED